MTHSCLFIVWLTVKIQQRCKSLTVIFQLPNFNFSSLKPLIHKSLSRFSEQTYVGIYSTSTTQITVQSIRNFLRVFNSPAYFSIKSHFNQCCFFKKFSLKGAGGRNPHRKEIFMSYELVSLLGAETESGSISSSFNTTTCSAPPLPKCCYLSLIFRNYSVIKDFPGAVMGKGLKKKNQFLQMVIPVANQCLYKYTSCLNIIS